ncbi:MAG TPA: 1,4-dihydroxy-2-naphthoate polyprenyltransferase [Marmoricola sp.]|nr:1,4-dihydroxy-2-naphthoate polyprenyltransferase [Marmoricola sp.]
MATPAQWIEGARPRTLPAAVAPVLAGTGVAACTHLEVWWKAGLAMVVALALQVGVNYANDYSDGIRGTDEQRVGPLRLTGSGAATPRSVKLAAFAAFGVAAAAGLVLAATTAWWLVAAGLVCVLAAWFYTGGRHPYGYAGLGEVMVFVFFGLVAVMGTTYVQAQDAYLHGAPQGWVSYSAHPVPPAPLPAPFVPSLYAAIGIGALACAILVANNLRDIPTDEQVGKRTLAVLLGEDRSRGLYVILVGASVVALVAVAVVTTWWALVALASLLLLVPACRVVAGGARGPALVPVLQRTGQGELVYGLALFLGLLLAR